MFTTAADYILDPSGKFKISKMFSGPKNSRKPRIFCLYTWNRLKDGGKKKLLAGLGLSCSVGLGSSARHFWKERPL